MNRKMEQIITIDKNKCIKCNKCNNVCPLVRWMGFKNINDANIVSCFKCGHCVAVCSKKAITHTKLTGMKPIGKIPSGNEMLNLIKSRRSIRVFKNKKIKKEDWNKIIEAVKYTNTAHNSEDINMIIIENDKIIDNITNLSYKFIKSIRFGVNNFFIKHIYNAMLGKSTASWFKNDLENIEKQKVTLTKENNFITFNAPAIILLSGPKKEKITSSDCCFAAQTIMLLAPTLGMGTCYSGILAAAFLGFYPPIINTIKIPKGQKVFSVLLIGYEKYKYSFIPPRKDRKVIFI